MVPEPEFDSYYGRQIIKTPTWKTPDVPLYLFLGGMSGASALLGQGAAMSGRPTLERAAWAAAAGGAGVGTGFLIHDLGRPARFLNMLRMFKVTSPLSVGSFILAPFSAFATAAAASNFTGKLPVLGRVAGAGAAALGAPLATYTAALLANTAVPSWHEAHKELPFVFGGSGAAAAGGLAMLATPIGQSGPARRMAVAGAGVELVASELMQRRLGLLAEPYQNGRPGLLMKAARAATAAGTLLTALGGRSRAATALAGTSMVSGSVLTRFGVFEAGIASAQDPKYTVLPQNQRVARRNRNAARSP